MVAGVRPIMRRASSPTAWTRPVNSSIATTEGSKTAIPPPRTKTRVFAVPRSIASSRPRWRRRCATDPRSTVPGLCDCRGFGERRHDPYAVAMTTCPACGHENRPEARFCDSCGAPFTVTEGRELRKVVTILFCDVVGSTALGERVDPEPLRRLMGSYYEEMRRIVERHGGTVEKFIGDAVMAVFGVPQAHEDDALRAVRAAAEMQAAAAPLELEIRIGINTGEVVTGEGETLVTGDAVNVAARLEQAAAAGETLIGSETRGLVRDAVETEETKPLELKGKAEPLQAHRVLAVDPDAPFVARRLDRPMVGRTRELGRLLGDFEHS